VLEQREALEEQIEAVRAERGRLFRALEAQPGVTPYPSEANFVLFRSDEVEAGAVHERLLEAGVLVRYFGGQGRLGRCLRVTVGRPEENEAFVAALGAALKTQT
jgi:histidinol-phosphate aminotransferase